MLEFAIGLVVLIIVVTLAFRVAVEAVTVFEFEKGLKYSSGRYAGLRPPGMYWLIRLFSVIRKVDLRPTFVSVPGQEVLSADGVALKVSLAAKYRVADPEVAIHHIEDYQAALYLELQVALRQVIGGADIDTVLESRPEFGKRITEMVAAKAQAVGLEVLEVEIKDVMFPGDLKKIFTQVVKARQEGLAALEKARGETAALRNLANAARLVDRNPALMQLRMLQTMGQSSGNTMVVGLPSTSGPIPIKPAGAEPLESPKEGSEE
jgi:regulator of protease activity HflC (stomatin/prohibitin superfamily)